MNYRTYFSFASSYLLPNDVYSKQFRSIQGSEMVYLVWKKLYGNPIKMRKPLVNSLPLTHSFSIWAQLWRLHHQVIGWMKSPNSIAMSITLVSVFWTVQFCSRNLIEHNKAVMTGSMTWQDLLNWVDTSSKFLFFSIAMHMHLIRSEIAVLQ